MKKVLAIGLLAVLPLAANAQKKAAPTAAPAKKAAEPLAERYSGQGYGLAGCGLGSMVFGQQKGLIQVVAATLNGTGVQTVGITLGTSNCSQPGVFAKANQFIETNKVALENDIVRGEGENLASLGSVLECSNNDFGASMKSNYVSAFPTGGASSDQLSAIALKACVN